MSQIQKLYISESEASQRYGYSRQWFQRCRWRGEGPKFIKVNGGRVLYPLEQTDNWFQSFGCQQSTSAQKENNDGLAKE
jgi:predicted DNA-binding transcriptional regulator AlpA